MTNLTTQYANQLDGKDPEAMGAQCFKSGGHFETHNPADHYIIDTMDDILDLEEFTMGFIKGWEAASEALLLSESTQMVAVG